MSKKHTHNNGHEAKHEHELPHSVKVLIWDPEADLVLVLLKKAGDCHLKPDLPGGSRNHEESVANALAREVLEETGLVLGESSDSPNEHNGRALYVNKVPLRGLDVRLSSEHEGAMLVPLCELSDWFKDTHWHNLVETAVNEINGSRAPAALAA
ncbi:NUDIX hydrolase [Candidatus Saccharibacteria bacterium]|nr:MAG: NUDIX hydrolase [Candidatus Saccharibacteria bacterium]